MFLNSKRLLALVLALVLVLGMVPASARQAEAAEEKSAPTPEDYAAVDAVFDQINAMEASPAKKNASDTEKLEAAKSLVQRSSNFVEGTLEQNGNSFTWWTEEGIRCVYSPRMQKIKREFTPENGRDEVVNEPVATKGGSPTGKQVYLIGPYYGYDSDFTDQYKNEAKRIASAIGDTDGYTLYSGTAATIDNVAKAVSNGAVVIFDSHGSTDYENPYDEYDFITGANYSYLCLNSSDGITYDDYYDGALYDDETAWVNGDVIANHMTKNSPGGILWMAICLGMGTNTMCEPLRAKGVEVVYGYSESVTFAGDYLFEEAFWDSMTAGKTVAQSIADMKNTWGNWDWSQKIASYYGYASSDSYTTITEARDDFIAFPVVVSDEDTHPGKRTAGYKDYSGFYGADSLQTVKSTYTLFGSGSTAPDPTDPTEPTTPSQPDIPTQGVYEKVTSQAELTTGKYVLIAETGYAPGVYQDGWLTAEKPVVAGNRVTDTKDAVWTLTVTSGGVTITDEYGVTVAPKGGNNNGIKAANYVWAVSFANGTFQFAGTGSDTVVLASNKNSANKFRGYKKTTVSGNPSAYPSNFTLYKLVEVTPEEPPVENPELIPGDLDGNAKVTADDVVALLLHISMPDMFFLPDGANTDYNKDGKVNTEDAVTLLLHVSMPDQFPLT